MHKLYMESNKYMHNNKSCQNAQENTLQNLYMKSSTTQYIREVSAKIWWIQLIINYEMIL